MSASNKPMRLTRNFTREEMIGSEMAERFNIDNTPSFAIMQNVLSMARWLQGLRDFLCKKHDRDVVIIVKSGYRSPELNKRVGGSKKSAHLSGLAADIIALGLSPYELMCDILEYTQEFDQVILEFDQWVHVGLCEDALCNRRQALEAIKQENSFGKLSTKYLTFRQRSAEYAFG